MLRGPIRLNPDLRPTRHTIGDDAHCIVIDDFLLDPHALIELACARAAHFYVPPAGYPGLNHVLEAPLLTDFHRFIRRRMSKEFGFFRGNATLVTGLSMATLPPSKLSNFQRLCHVDPRDVGGRRKYASLVYLYDNEALGGTAFYRWKRPDVMARALEMEQHDSDAAAAYLARHSAIFSAPPRYMTDSNELAELLTVVPARFNRMIFYSGEIPHSGHITAPELLTEDFRRGRLTLNCFVSVVPT